MTTTEHDQLSRTTYLHFEILLKLSLVPTEYAITAPGTSPAYRTCLFFLRGAYTGTLPTLLHSARSSLATPTIRPSTIAPCSCWPRRCASTLSSLLQPLLHDPHAEKKFHDCPWETWSSLQRCMGMEMSCCLCNFLQTRLSQIRHERGDRSSNSK